MTNLVTYNRLIISGTLTSAEVWSTSIGYSGVTGGDSTAVTAASELQGIADDIWDSLDNAGAAKNPFTQISSSGTIDRVRVEARNATTLLQAAEAVGTGPLPGTGAPTHPTTVCTCISLLTGLPGRRYRGRMYLPTLTGVVTTDFRVPESQRDATATTTAAIIDAWTAAFNVIDPGSKPTVVSLTGGVCTSVQQIRVGNVFDTQRRRRDALAESYTVADVL